MTNVATAERATPSPILDKDNASTLQNAKSTCLETYSTQMHAFKGICGKSHCPSCFVSTGSSNKEDIPISNPLRYNQERP